MRIKLNIRNSFIKRKERRIDPKVGMLENASWNELNGKEERKSTTNLYQCPYIKPLGEKNDGKKFLVNENILP